jgi:hypothetical protein
VLWIHAVPSLVLPVAHHHLHSLPLPVQVFSALDRAQRKLGFHHADLGMRNIMEHYPRYGRLYR